MKRVCQNLLVPALDAGLQKDRPYQSDFIGPVLMRSREGRGAREQDSFDTPSINNIQNEENRFILWWHNR